MKYINFKRYKFSTIFKNINFKRYGRILAHVAEFIIFIIEYVFSSIYTSFNLIRHHFLKTYNNIDFKKYNFSRIYRYIDIRRYNFSKIFKFVNLRRLDFKKIYKYLNFIRVDFKKFYKYFDFRRYNFYKLVDFKRNDSYKVSKYISFKKYKYIPIYLASFAISSILIYLSVPIFFNYDKSNIENILCTDFNIKCEVKSKIRYSFFPSPRIKFNNLTIKDFSNNNKILANIENIAIKLSVFNLLNKTKFNFTQVELENGEINFNFKEFDKYKKLSRKNFDLKSIKLKKGEIKFFDGEKYITSINNINLKYKSRNNIDDIVLKGKFLNDIINIKFQNKRIEKNSSKNIVLKLVNSKIFMKVDMPHSKPDEGNTSGNILFKKDKSRLTSIFDYKENQIVFKNANLRNTFLEGKFDGVIKFLPYFDFDLNVDLNGVNFNKFHSYFVALDTKNIFKINEKINGQLNLTTNKLYSKYNLINSFESRLKFINGNILIEQLLLNMGKLGAADISGIIENNKKFTNFKFENNIFIDNLKRFYNKFGIYNKEKTSSSLFVRGSFDLKNLNLRFQEISNKQKFKDDDVSYIEKEFNDILLKNGYVSLFNFPKLKEFVKLVVAEEN